MSSSLIGRAPVFSRLASRWADWIVKPPEIRDEESPPRPVGYWCQSICGTEMSSLSSVMAKCWLEAASPRVSADSWPRSASLRVNFDHTPGPLPVKSKVTFGWPLSPGPLSKFCSGFLMSGAAEDRLVLEHVPGGQRLALGIGLLGADDDDALGDLDDLLGVERDLLVQRLLLQVGPALVGTGEDALALLVDQVELVARGLVAGVGARALRPARDGVEERQRRRDAAVAGRLAAGARWGSADRACSWARGRCPPSRRTTSERWSRPARPPRRRS
jgi:hypothetical protein